MSEVEIQCPECGTIYFVNTFGQYVCGRCNRIFTEEEIRERCGL